MFPFTKTIHILGYPHLWTPPSAVLIFQRMMAQRDQHAPRARAASRGPGPRIQELWGSLDDAGTGFTTCVGKSWYIIMVSIHIYIYIHTYMHTYIYIHTYIHRFIHSYIHTFIHSYIHTFIHIFWWKYSMDRIFTVWNSELGYQGLTQLAALTVTPFIFGDQSMSFDL